MSTYVHPSCLLYCHVSACHWATSCMDCHVSSVQCHMSNPYRCQLSLKIPNLSDSCHRLVMPHQHDDIMLTSPIVLLTSAIRPVDFDQLTFLHVWEIGQNTISFAYNVHLRKTLYGQNQRDEADAMELVSSNSRNLIFRPSWIHFGSCLPTKTFWSSKRVLTSHQVRDRPPHLLCVFKRCPMHLSHQDQLQNNHDN
jgi:hypothetical protein